VLKDIEKSTKKILNAEEIMDGYKYLKKVKMSNGNTFNLNITVGPIIEDKYYELSYETPTAVNKYYYDIKRVDENTIDVTYFEENFAKGSLNNWFHQLKKKLSQKSIEMKISNSLRHLEKIIIEEKSL
jgi:hydroxymethylpyrimidine pyrophosphatase-like HAD family hydrolase